MPSAKVGLADSSSTSRGTEYEEFFTSNDDDARETEGEFDMTFEVTVHGYGRYSKEEIIIAIRMCNALHHTFGNGNFEVRDEMGRTAHYDHLAHDSEHKGHEQTLRWVT
jgi:hypothetical protein